MTEGIYQEIFERPKCGNNEKCPNHGGQNWGILMIGRKLYCGDCIIRYNNTKMKREETYVQSLMEESNDQRAL